MSSSGGFNLSRWALEHIPLTRYLIVVLLLGGIFSYGKLGQDEDPPFTFRAMVVRAIWPGATALQMADQVTDKLEKKLQETPYIDKFVATPNQVKPSSSCSCVNLRHLRKRLRPGIRYVKKSAILNLPCLPV